MNKTQIVIAAALVGCAALYISIEGSQDMPDDPKTPSSGAGSAQSGENTPDPEDTKIEDEEPAEDVGRPGQISSPGVPASTEEMENLKREADRIEDN